MIVEIVWQSQSTTILPLGVINTAGRTRQTTGGTSTPYSVLTVVYLYCHQVKDRPMCSMANQKKSAVIHILGLFF
jgi:hypothetical protein